MSGGITIDKLLQDRGARLHGQQCDHEGAMARSDLTQIIEEDYSAFEPVRDMLLKRGAAAEGFVVTERHEQLFECLDTHRMIVREENRYQAASISAKRYLSGGWLEELAWLAADAAGADEAVYGQKLIWQVGEYFGENEIDLILRRGDRLGFASCKALQSRFNAENRKHRNRLMDALHEADNVADHFGQPGERVAVLVTTDLFDEVRDSPRYMALMGKAAALDVRIIPLEELGWVRLVNAVSELINPNDHKGEDK
jgi:hypothetical protein